MPRIARTLLLIAALLLTGIGTRPEAMLAQPALWVVCDSDSDTTIYLFGTVHLLRPDQRWFRGAVRHAFDSADTLVLEIPPMTQDAAQRVIARIGMQPDGPGLRATLTPIQRRRYDMTLDSLDMPAKALDADDPWLAANTLTLVPLLNAGYRQASAPEAVLADAAGRGHKHIAALETMTFQLGLFDRLPSAAQNRMLMRAVDATPDAVTDMNALVRAWGHGDVAAVGAKLDGEMHDFPPELASAILPDRNRRWASWIERRMQQPGTVFIAVGAGHLAGDQRVQLLLQHAGLKVARVQ